MTSSFQQCYTAAMVLNNIGIFLLESQAEEEAIRTLSSAIFLMRAVANGNSVTDSELVHTVQARLTEANQKLASCPVSSRLSDFHVITHQDIFNVVMNSCQRIMIAGEPSPLLLIRIERIASIVDDEEIYSPGFESSIILYNLGTAYLHMASTEELHSTKAAEKHGCAYGLFQLSYSILQTFAQDPIAQDHADFGDQYLPFMIRVLHSLVSTTSVLGLTSESAFYSSTISSLYQALQWEYNIMKLFPLHAARAA